MSQTIAPCREIESTAYQAAASGERVCCPTCEKTFAGGSVVTGGPVWDPVHQTNVVARRFYCDHCDHIVLWHQPCDAAGRVIGPCIDEPVIFTDPHYIDHMMTSYPCMKGVIE